MYYSVIPKLDKGEAGMLGTAGDFPACQRRFKESYEEEGLKTLRMPFSEDHYSDLDGAGCVPSASEFQLKKQPNRP